MTAQTPSERLPPQQAAGLPLSGIRVLDLSRVLAGPLCGMVLGDLGADVIKVEHPVRGDDTRDWGTRIGKTETAYFNSVNRNKRSVALDLQTAEGQALARELALKSDVVIQNFGGVERMGLEALTSERTTRGGLVTTQPHPEVGTVPVLSPPYRFDGVRTPVRSAPPQLGKDTRQVLQDLLGLSEQKLSQLKASGVTS